MQRTFTCPACRCTHSLPAEVGIRLHCSGKMVYLDSDLEPKIKGEPLEARYTTKDMWVFVSCSFAVGLIFMPAVAFAIQEWTHDPSKDVYVRYTLSVSPEKLSDGETFVHRFHTRDDKDRRHRSAAPVIPIELKREDGDLYYRTVVEEGDPRTAKWAWVKLDPNPNPITTDVPK